MALRKRTGDPARALPPRVLGEPAPALWELLERSLRPPVGDPRFWLIQALVALTGLLYAWTLRGGAMSMLGLPPTAVLALFLVPVMYAALNFGLAGSLATAAWVLIIGLASLLSGPGHSDAPAVLIQLAAIAGVAFFVGQRVEREVSARREAETARGSAWASEARFRSLFESSPAATLLVGPEGEVREANPAASALFQRGRPRLLGVRLSELVGMEPAEAMAAGETPVQELPGQAGDRFLRPVVSAWPAAAGGGFQVVFLDVSEERRRLGIKDAYAAYVLRGQEEERARIAQELHDEPLQQVVQLCRLLERLDQPAAGGSGHGGWLAEARAVALGIGDQLRRIARGLRPPALEDLGLVAALRLLTRDLDRRTRLSTRLSVVGEPRRLDPAVELGLFRIAQEGLHNVERHAHATSVEMALSFGPGRVQLTVSDDGQGLPASRRDGRPPHQGLGLIGMHERASLLGGSFSLSSTPGQGTRLEAAIPAG